MLKARLKVNVQILILVRILHALRNIEINAAELIYRILERIKINLYKVVYRNARKIFDCNYRVFNGFFRFLPH